MAILTNFLLVYVWVVYCFVVVVFAAAYDDAVVDLFPVFNNLPLIASLIFFSLLE